MLAKTRFKILLVDDNPDGLYTMAMFMRSLGHAIETARDGQAALSAASQMLPDIIFLDIKLPDMNGYELGRRLRKLPGLEDVRLFALTGIPGEEFERMSGYEGFQGHFAKPISSDVLEALLSGD